MTDPKSVFTPVTVVADEVIETARSRPRHRLPDPRRRRRVGEPGPPRGDPPGSHGRRRATLAARSHDDFCDAMKAWGEDLLELAEVVLTPLAAAGVVGGGTARGAGHRGAALQVQAPGVDAQPGRSHRRSPGPRLAHRLGSSPPLHAGYARARRRDVLGRHLRRRRPGQRPAGCPRSWRRCSSWLRKRSARSAFGRPPHLPAPAAADRPRGIAGLGQSAGEQRRLDAHHLPAAHRGRRPPPGGVHRPPRRVRPGAGDQPADPVPAPAGRKPAGDRLRDVAAPEHGRRVPRAAHGVRVRGPPRAGRADRHRLRRRDPHVERGRGTAHPWNRERAPSRQTRTKACSGSVGTPPPACPTSSSARRTTPASWSAISGSRCAPASRASPASR